MCARPQAGLFIFTGCAIKAEMERVPLYLACGVLVLVAVSLAPVPETVRLGLGVVAVADCGVLIALLLQGTRVNQPAPLTTTEDDRPTLSLEEASQLADYQTLAVLGALQEKGRLVDFLMDDIGRHDDAAVGAAARVVYHGCRDALLKMAVIEPVASEDEGVQVSVPANAMDAYQLAGNPPAQGAVSGTLTHKGWRARELRFPKVDTKRKSTPVIAPAKVEV